MSQPSPGTVRRTSHRGDQIKQELVGKAVDRWRLPESKAQTNRVLDTNAVRRNRFFHQEINEAAPPGVRPDVRMQKAAQRIAGLECDFTLPDPLENRIPPLPVSHQPHVLFSQV